jgi:hypothetical protein
MHRRSFVRLLAAAPLGMPGPYPGRVVSVRSAKCVDTSTGQANDALVREMLAQGMRTLTGASTTSAAWRRFFEPSDVVGIKVNCGGYPHWVSAYEIVADVVRQLMGIGVPVSQIYVYERFQNQMDEVNYAPHLPEGVQIVAAERANRNVDNSGYDPASYLEADLFGEEDTRSNIMRLVSRRLTKIINIPNVKDHGATGVTGCLKNIAYGSFSNVARTHSRGKSHSYSIVGTLAAMEPLRSRTVLQIMDGLRADEQRALRVYGSEVVICRLTAEAGRARLHLINYGGREIDGLRVRLRGAYADGEADVAGAGRLVLEDRVISGGATEFTIPRIATYAVIDLGAAR